MWDNWEIDPSLDVAWQYAELFPQLNGVEFEWCGDGRSKAEVLPVGMTLTDEQKQTVLSIWLQIADKDVRSQSFTGPNGEECHRSGIYRR